MVNLGKLIGGGFDAKKEFGTDVRQIVVTGNVFQRGPNGKCGGYGPVTSYDDAGAPVTLEGL